MFKKVKKSKKSLVILVVLLALVLVYFMFKGKGEPLVSVSEPAEGNLIGQELLEELDRLKSLNKINTDFFSDPVFGSLIDTKVKPVSQPIGRNNLFTPSGNI